MNVRDLITDPPRVHLREGRLISDWKLAYEALLFLDGHLAEGMKTQETGAGVSTVLFAIKGTDHTCIAPDENEVSRIKRYCEKHQILLAKSILSLVLQNMHCRDYKIIILISRLLTVITDFLHRSSIGFT